MKVKKTDGAAPVVEGAGGAETVDSTTVVPTSDAKKTRAKQKKRTDFPTWTEWCDFKKGKAEEKLAVVQADIKHWVDVRENENLMTVDKKMKKIEKLTAVLEELQKELKESQAAE